MWSDGFDLKECVYDLISILSSEVTTLRFIVNLTWLDLIVGNSIELPGEGRMKQLAVPAEKTIKSTEE